MKHFFRKVFFSSEGLLRTGWKLAGGIAAYGAVFYGTLYALGAAFGALFEAWGLTSDNLLRAPLWAQQVVRWHTDVCYGIAYLTSAAAGLLLARRWSHSPVRSRVRVAARALMSGLAMGMGLTLLALGFDCVRPEQPLSEPYLSATQMLAAAVIVLGKASGEVLTRRLVFGAVKRRWAAYLAGSLASLFLLGSLTSPLGAINALLLGAVSCALYERGGLAASTALAASWTVWTSLAFGFPGTSAPVGPVYALYHVSEAWLTGGYSGPDRGLWMTLCLLLGTAILFREEFRALARVLVARRKKHDANNQNRAPAATATGRRRR